MIRTFFAALAMSYAVVQPLSASAQIRDEIFRERVVAKSASGEVDGQKVNGCSSWIVSTNRDSSSGVHRLHVYSDAITGNVAYRALAEFLYHGDLKSLHLSNDRVSAHPLAVQGSHVSYDGKVLFLDLLSPSIRPNTVVYEKLWLTTDPELRNIRHLRIEEGYKETLHNGGVRLTPFKKLVCKF